MASLYVIRGKDNGQHFAIRGLNATIGRESSNQIQLHDTEVSRQHAKVVRSGASEYQLIDCGSSNGTFVNSRRIKSQTLKSGDRVQVGRSLLIFTGGPEPFSSGSVDSVEIIGQEDPDEVSQIRSAILSHGSVALGSQQDSQLFSPTQEEESRSFGENNWEIVYQVSQAIHRTTDLNDLLGQVLDLIFKWIACDRGCILMVDDHSGKLAPICSLDRKQAESGDRVSKPIKISQTILDHVVTAEEGVLTSNAQDDSRWQNAESVNSLGVREAICVPMLGRYGLVGAIYVDTAMSVGRFAERQGKSTFDDKHLKLMLAISGQAALAIEDTQFYRAMVQAERLAVMGQTIANLSHHVKNILQGVSGGNYLVENGLEKEDLALVKRGWYIVQRNQERISNMVMDMLSFSKEREPSLLTQDIRNLIDDVVQLVEGRAAERECSIEWNRPSEPIQVDYDEEGLHRAVLNVVSNAIDATCIEPDDESDATAEDARRVKIELEEQGPNFCIMVTDNGCGISKNDADKIFSPFESSKGSRGTGLGLPVSRKVLREHGGDITFNSQANEGTTFILKWPGKQNNSGGGATIRG